MTVDVFGGLSPIDRAVEQVRNWPSLRLRRAECGAGRALTLGSRQIVHLHGDGQAEMHLTWAVIRRMSGALLERGQVTMAPGSDWVRLRLDNDDDVRLFGSLTSVAIKANSPALNEPHRPTTGCSRTR